MIITASIEKRVMSFMFDTFIAFALIVLDAGLTFLGVTLQYVLATIFLFFGYFFFYLIWKGQSFGKKIEGIKICNLDGTDVSKGKAMLRQLFIIIVSIVSCGLYPLIAGIMLMFGAKEHFAIHDRIFKTMVRDVQTEKVVEDRKDKDSKIKTEEADSEALFDALKNDESEEE